MSRKFQHRKDGNHDAIQAAIERRGYLFVDTSQTGLGIDGLVVAHGRMVPVEIKDPSSSRGAKLTPREQQAHQRFAAHGIRVELLMTEADLDVLGRETRSFYKEP